MLKNIQLWGGGGLALSLLLITGCGTVTNGTKQKISISTSTGQQVIARVDGKKVTIPAKDIAVSRKKGADIRVLEEDNPCFETTNYSISGKGKVSGVFWINIFSGGFFGSTTDAISGGMWQFNDPNFVVPVTKKPNCTPPAKPKVTESKESTESKQNKKAKEENKQETKQKDDKAQDKAKTTDPKKQKSKK
ncbi:MAG: hypothetical protein SPJ83_04845 [Helicobacter sp.]|uniref:hypothetical protein n=1 Tax=Helicobacter sp. TaxID=218 RepID=UPI002A911206|nr:hypothetical protein [Helicobacter sp.]MDY5822112.1 hypothetical protein [Helicobacter sp.]